MKRALVAFAALLGSILVAPTPALAAGGGFSVLTYNVAGLPELISSAETDRKTAHTAIGQRLGPYDVVHVQEDFNYHAHLYAADTTHAHRTPTSGGAGIGSGLNSLSKYAYDGDDFERGDWNSCQFDSGDCLTPKGFTFARHRLAEGVYVDFYNLHTNAGTSAGDQQSRADNLAQLTAFIASHSAGNAVIVMGDTNTRYTRAADTIRGFVAANGLTDAWVKLERGGTPPAAGADALVCDKAAVTDACEVVDKILYRGSRFVTLNATGYHNEDAGFRTADGLMLSDHFPISTSFTWSTNPAYEFSEQFGGPHGSYYNDIDAVSGKPATVGVRAGSRVDQVSLGSLAHGGAGGTAKSLTLGGNEYVTSAKLCRAQHNGHTRIFYARFTTNLGNSVAGGTTTPDCVTRTAPAGFQIAGFHGRSGSAVDKVGFIYSRR
ncbi:jacalin-like lectin [Actinoplanes sp. NEAU-A12]|uniref:Jacalin-like lectin n=1 Tax=Actinoplanes sandaracinus TaxID=3045177 RepID=A0ABT6WMN8_9ACTN|nr:jacalin-like lectin [Actinoplanes sandaracinus]MDI6101002.1 jacalin-like lectin [Actinoplanes sandaracinus]